ncbi:MAG: phosphoadenylyl-sulfate reductase [Sulfobacillus acidophilus]|uniref:Adenosine 5'-phosphosulfate reductase n=1 Tax=Sulfobacillus acidophilus TaxID=53633 RepID=A0A2T2WMZ3_9FIRM|nr:MAG: phosphoadenylyl-sulfate reductase [Sulfobacillus acidophilus]
MNTALDQLAAQLEEWDPLDILRWADKTYGVGLVLASSFGAEDMVLVDMWIQVNPHPTIFYLDTGLLFTETYQLIRRVEQHYRVQTIRVATSLTLEEQAGHYGEALWSTNPDHCCTLRKVQPLQQYLADKTAWITGIRRDQTVQRRHAAVIAYDARYHLIKINPLVRWNERDVFRYLVRHQVPYNPLHDCGYPSIGCMPCTHAIKPGDDPRSGRWAGQEKTECGLHL